VRCSPVVRHLTNRFVMFKTHKVIGWLSPAMDGLSPSQRQVSLKSWVTGLVGMLL
jgi:hypothetical protein